MNNDTDSDTKSINTTDTIDQSELTPQVIDVNAYYHKIQERYNFLQTCDEQYKSYNNGILFEYICAIIVNARRFDDVSTLVKEYYDLPFSDSDHYSAGVDLLNNVNNVLYQCKKYDNTTLLRKHLGTFFHTLLRLKEFRGQYADTLRFANALSVRYLSIDVSVIISLGYLLIVIARLLQSKNSGFNSFTYICILDTYILYQCFDHA